MIRSRPDFSGETRSLIIEFAKFGLVGVVNTAVGFATIMAMMSLAGLGPVAANMVGYTIGLFVSFVLNKRYTFAGKPGETRRQLLSFLAVFAVAYTVNLIVLTALVTEIWPGLAQALAMVAYTVTFFGLARVFVFADGSGQSPLHRALTRLAVDPVSPRLGFLCCLILLGTQILPLDWSGNEVNYFDLSYRVARPDLFTQFHAVFDSSNARFASLYLIGILVDASGFEAAHVLLTLVLWLVLSAGLLSLARALNLSLVTLTLGLLAFFELDQTLMGGEWIFDGVEAKVMAYSAVIFAISAAVRSRYVVAVMLAALATYLHFLVGGYWGLALIALAAAQGETLRRIARLAAIFAALIAPIFLVVLIERIGATPPDLTGLDLTANQIYAEFRNPHHVAPFFREDLYQNIWRPGILWTLAGIIALIIARIVRGHDGSAVLVWAAGLNLFLVAAFAIAYLDQNSHALAPLYLFRPAALTLLISLFVLTHTGLHVLPGVLRAGVTGVALVLFAVFAVPVFTRDAIDSLTPETLQSELDRPQQEMVAWVRGNTAQDDPLLFADWPAKFQRRYNISFLAMERLTGRPTFVAFKFVPTGASELVRWYRLLKWRDAVFANGCAEIATYPVAYVILRSNFDGVLADCTNTVWANDQFQVLKIGAPSGP